jgi:hypothetical protein
MASPRSRRGETELLASFPKSGRVETSRRLDRSDFDPADRDRGGNWRWQQHQEQRSYGHSDDTGDDCEAHHDNRLDNDSGSDNDGGPDDHRPGHCATHNHPGDNACAADSSAYNCGPAAGYGCTCCADATTDNGTGHTRVRTGRLLPIDEQG